MIRVIIVDDSNDKVINIIKVIRSVSENVQIDVVTDVISAQNKLYSTKYDLLVLDANLPVRYGESTSMESGKNLLNEINRKKTLHSPYFVISITQYGEECKDISNIWRTIFYSPENTDWHQPMINLVNHIIKCEIPNANFEAIKPTLFLEGRTDEKIITAAINIFRPDLLEKITIKSDKNAGASWVARQIIAWSHSLYRDKAGIYLRAVGLLDGDVAGQNALSEISRVVKNDSAESKTFKTIRLSPTYARHIISIKQKGLNLPVTLEEMFQFNDWNIAAEKKWLELRQNAETLLTNPDKWNKYDISLKDYIASLGLNQEEGIYMNCFKEDFKLDFANQICSYNECDQKKSLTCFEKLIDDISAYLLPVNDHV